MKNILCFGDSNTWGYDADRDDRYPYSVRWTGRLQGLLGSEYRIIEEGQGGRTTVWEDPIEEYKSGKNYLPPCLETHSPLDMIILMLGTNDLKKRFSLSAFDVAKGAERLLQIIHSHKCTGQKEPPKVLLICPAPLGEGICQSPLYGMFTEEELRVSKCLVPCFETVAAQWNCLFLNAGDYVKISPTDSLHFTAEDHAALAQAIYDVVTKYFEQPA